MPWSKYENGRPDYDDAHTWLQPQPWHWYADPDRGTNPRESAGLDPFREWRVGGLRSPHTRNGFTNSNQCRKRDDLDPPWCEFFDSSTSFGMIRGGHIDVCVLGGMEVDVEGNLANWMIPAKRVTGMGGAMDLVHGAKQVIVMLRHFSKSQQPKLVRRCELPLTGQNVVHKIVTDLGIFEPTGTQFRVLKLAPEITVDQLRISAELLLCHD